MKKLNDPSNEDRGELIARILERELSLLLKGTIIDKKRGIYGAVLIVDQGSHAYPRLIAYKTIDEQIPESKQRNFERELRQWFKARGHALILTPFYIKFYAGHPLVCMPYCEMDLQTYLEKHEKLDSTQALLFTAQTIKGLIVAKNKGIEAHQDLKPGNILLEDFLLRGGHLLLESLHIPAEDLGLFRFRVRLADFGLANALKELGKPQGTRPYMAPEQYTPEEYEKFSPDIFAVGIMLSEMLTGIHPCGKPTKKAWKNWNKKKWEKWAKTGERKTEIGNDKHSRKITALINSMLLPNPQERPSLEEALYQTIDVLSEISRPTAEQLKILFEYYDTLSGHLEYEKWLDSLMRISELPRSLDIVISELLDEISVLERNLNQPRDAVHFCQVCHCVSGMLLRRGIGNDKDKAKSLAGRIVSEARKWREKIKVHHRYPELKFREKYLFKPPRLRDFEIYAEIIGYGRELLQSIIGVDKTEEFFRITDSYTQSAYLYSLASYIWLKGQVREAIGILDKCMELNPSEPVFYYMKGLWTLHRLQKGLALGDLKNKETTALKKTIRENVQRALEINPDWEEPKSLIEDTYRLTR